MNIKRLIQKGFLLCLITNLTFGQVVKEQLADSKIEKVTVFLSEDSVTKRTMKMYFEETYLGDSYLNVNNQDTLSISLGRDKGVVVSRNKMTNFRKKQSLGNNKVDSRGYEITVRNTKRQAINLTVEDQFPISKAKEIEVNDQEADEAEIDKETGKITWRLKLEPNKEKKLKHKFTVKSPKGMVLNLD